MSTATEKRQFSVPELAEHWGVSPNKVLGWLHDGQLRGLNMATNPSGRPRYSIFVADVEAFEQGREAHRSMTTPKKPRSRANMKIESFI